jgi:hypothetical protein
MAAYISTFTLSFHAEKIKSDDVTIVKRTTIKPGENARLWYVKNGFIGVNFNVSDCFLLVINPMYVDGRFTSSFELVLQADVFRRTSLSRSTRLYHHVSLRSRTWHRDVIGPT